MTDKEKTLLIDSDGYISMSVGQNKKLMEAIDTSSDNWHVPYPFIVDCVFQKFGVKNANGRIYPENILKREVERYQQKIVEHRALGECYTEDAMILTENGWKGIDDVKEGENILTLNIETNEIEIKPIIRKIEYDYNGEMIRLKNTKMNDLVTPNHKYPIYTQNNTFRGFYTAEDIFNKNIVGFKRNYIPKQGKWTVQGDDIYVLKGCTEEEVSDEMLRLHPYVLEDKEIPMSSMMKFMGIYLAEGCLDSRRKAVYIYQKKKDVTEDIKMLLDEMDLEYSVEESDEKYSFRIPDQRLANLLKPLGICYKKYIPTYFKQQSKENLRYLYDWFVKGDGRVRGDKNRTESLSLTDDVFSVSKQLILDLNEIQLKCGYSGNFHMEKRDNDRYIGDRLIEGKNCKPMYFSLRSLSKGISLDDRFLKATKENYNGKVYCVEVENHTWYVMQNDKCHWTGNCNHPAETSIDLGRVSHNITELHWEGRTLVGKMELNVTKGFVTQGICSSLGDTVANLLINGYKIGVSSRGVGSVENKMGAMVVGNDFELICFDIVADPSTPNAYIFSNDEEKSQYVEANEKNKEKNQLLEKIKQAKSLLD